MGNQVAMLCVGLISAVACTQPAQAQQQPVLKTDSTASCPIDFVRAVFVHSFSLSSRAGASLFRDSSFRIISLGTKGFRGPDLRRRIAQLAHVSEKDVLGGGALEAFFGTPKFESSFLTQSGDGAAILIRDSGAGLISAICAIRDSAVVVPGGVFSLGNSEALLLEAMLSGKPHALAMRVVTLPRKERRGEQLAFLDGVKRVAASERQDLLPSETSALIDSSLRTLLSHSARDVHGP
jgi:hypothetical protein